jgi:hypothetical protein
MNIHLKTVMAALMLAGPAAAAQTAPRAADEQASALDICERIALAKVQGQVLERHAEKYPTGYNYEYLIKARDGRRLIVAVDGKTRKVFAVMDSEPAKIETGEEEEPDALSPE